MNATGNVVDCPCLWTSTEGFLVYNGVVRMKSQEKVHDEAQAR